MSKFFIAAALGLGLLSAGTAANAATALRVDTHASVTPVQYQGGHRPHYAPPRHFHRHYAPPPRHYGWRAPVHRPYRQYGWR
jgi:hypothetical protein